MLFGVGPSVRTDRGRSVLLMDDAAINYGELPIERPGSAVVVFDGHCGMCTRSARLLTRLDRREALELVASQAPGVLDRTGVTEHEAEVAAWTVAPGGTKVGGARAIALALAVGRGARWPVLPWKLPLAPWVLDRIYQFVADHRGWFPGETPWCDAHPGQCAR